MLLAVVLSFSLAGCGGSSAPAPHPTLTVTAADASRVYWLTHESNAQAMLLYDKIADRTGFVQYRKMPL